MSGGGRVLPSFVCLVAPSYASAMTLEARSLSFGYRKPVLRDLSLRFEPGRITLVLGPNGSGKSTLLRLLLGLLEPGNPGACTLDGVAMHALAPARRAEHLAYVPHHPHVGYTYTVRQYVSFSLAARAPAGGAVDHALDQLELGELAEVPIVELSAGQMQRASIARALAQITTSQASPRFLLADEPTSALDPRHVAQVLSLFGSLAHQGVGVVLTMHDLTTGGSIADDVFVLDSGGRLAAQGRPEAVLVPSVLERVFRTGFGFFESQGHRVIVRRDVHADAGAMR